MSAVRVGAHPLPSVRGKTPWLVWCEICKPGFLGISLDALGWAAKWEVAQQFAVDHARKHREQACPTCGHQKPLSSDDKAAV